jgi:hypothetical protein
VTTQQSRTSWGAAGRAVPLLGILLVGLAACAGKARSVPSGAPAGESGGNGGQLGGDPRDASLAGGSGGTSDAGSSAGTSDAGVQRTRECGPADLPGAPCTPGTCFGTRCGIRFDLECTAGEWQVRRLDGESTAWDFVCPPENEPVFDLSQITRGQCCGEPGRGTELPPSEGCGYCPETAPNDQDSCALPADCSPRIVDCFYSCCCYGTVTWAQCDGERWHVTTNCSWK